MVVSTPRWSGWSTGDVRPRVRKPHGEGGSPWAPKFHCCFVVEAHVFVLEVWLDVFEVKMVGSCREWFSGCFFGVKCDNAQMIILDPFCYCLGRGFVKKRIFFGEYPSLPARVFLIWEEQCTHISSNSYDCYATLIFASSPLHRTRTTNKNWISFLEVTYFWIWVHIFKSYPGLCREA